MFRHTSSYSSIPEDGKPRKLNASLRRFTSCYSCLNSLVAIMTDSAPRFGFVAFAETWNGRMAMLGFVIGLATEVLTGQSILSQIGLG